MKDFIDEVRRELPKAFESEDYVAKREETIDPSKRREGNSLLKSIEKPKRKDFSSKVRQ